MPRSSTGTLLAGAAYRTINPSVGTGKGGLRLFGDPIQAIESDLRAGAVVFAVDANRVALITLDLCTVSQAEAAELRALVGEAIGVPASNVLINLSHNHSSPALPDFMYMTDEPEELALRQRYKLALQRQVVDAALDAVSLLQPARIGVGWGESDAGVYRREWHGETCALGEVPDHPIDRTVGVMRVDGLDGEPIASIFRFSAHPVTVGPRSMVASSDFPGPARDVIERNLGGLGVFLQGCGGNVNPAVGIGYEIDCRDTKNRVGMQLGGEALRVAASIRTNTKPGSRTTLGSVPNILVTPWEQVADVSAVTLAATEATIQLEYEQLPTLSDARQIENHWMRRLDECVTDDSPDWQLRVARKYRHWSRKLVEAVESGNATAELGLQAVRLGDAAIVGIAAEVFFETGLEVRKQSPFLDTFVLGYTNGVLAYLPRGDDYPADGWKADQNYALPDLMPQAWQLPSIFHRDSATRVVGAAVELLESLA